MKYFLVVGEASGDLHASNLMREILVNDPEAEFRFFGGDKMAMVGGVLIKHYRDMAFMGIVAVVMNARTILRNMAVCKSEIAAWQPDVLLLVDYASFNLKIAAYVKNHFPHIPVHFYISPKIWAWKEYRIGAFKKYIDKMYVILPFETAFFSKHEFPVSYVGNPCLDSVADFFSGSFDEATFRLKYELDERPVLLLLPGSRKGEIKGNLPLMLKVASEYADFQLVVAGAPGQDEAFYASLLPEGTRLLFGETYSLLRIAYAAVVTSGTATLETALFNVPQVVCFSVGFGHLPNWIFKHFMHVPYFSLVNLIADRPVVHELLGILFTQRNLTTALEPLLSDTSERRDMLMGYAEIRKKLGQPGAAKKVAILLNESLLLK
jgi:lipid-A-disaccharide synthase